MVQWQRQLWDFVSKRKALRRIKMTRIQVVHSSSSMPFLLAYTPLAECATGFFRTSRIKARSGSHIPRTFLLQFLYKKGRLFLRMLSESDAGVCNGEVHGKPQGVLYTTARTASYERILDPYSWVAMVLRLQQKNWYLSRVRSNYRCWQGKHPPRPYTQSHERKKNSRAMAPKQGVKQHCFLTTTLRLIPKFRNA